MDKVPGLMIKMVSQCLSGVKQIQMNETSQGYLAHIPPPPLKRHLCCSINPYSQVLLHSSLSLPVEVALS